MSGEHDDELKWPFRRSITIQLIDQKEGKDHLDDFVNFANAPDHCTRKVERRLTLIILDGEHQSL